ncbi:MAG: hypothetical protein E3J78_03035 [Candidatus Cloacimonadota bacterium]|jgi:hypothetical protein|nr:MAG: hypothetical protein E3J78_03035 [Candidatus Cloacimonadota bacterium]
MKELLQELTGNTLVLGSFFFKDNENLFSFSEQYTIPESRIKRIALVLTQTMDALGGIDFDRFLLEGEERRISIFSCNGGYCGIVFKKSVSFRNIEDIYQTLISKASAPGIKEKAPRKEIKKEAVKVKEKPPRPVEKKEEKIAPASIFDQISGILNEYLGDFSETIYENQMSDLVIKPESCTTTKAKKLCFSLQKASAMLIGPSQAKEMVGKLLSLIKE